MDKNGNDRFDDGADDHGDGFDGDDDDQFADDDEDRFEDDEDQLDDDEDRFEDDDENQLDDDEDEFEDGDDGAEGQRGTARDRIAAMGPLLGGIAIGMVLLGIIWLVVAGASGGGGGADTSANDPGTARNDVGNALGRQPATSQRPVETRLDRCTEAADLLKTPLERGKTALDQWSVHVGAMNKLVVGAITLPQATAFWSQTRVGARTAIKDFDEADKAVRRQGVDCPSPHLLGRSSAQLRGCSHYVGALMDELDDARTAITTWDHHVQAMDMLRLGKLSPARATEMWLSMWQRGTDELDRFRAQERVVRSMPGCDGSGGTSAGRDSRTGMHGNGSGSSGASPGPTDSSMDSMGSMG